MDAAAPFHGLFEMAEPSIQSTDPENERDIALMARIAEGDEVAFRALVERHQNMVVGMIARMLNDPMEAEDLAQRVFLRIWKHAKRWKPEAKFTTYLFTIARNLVYNESRRRSRKKEVSSDQRSDEFGAEMPADSRIEPDSETLRNEMHDEIDRAIAELPENQRAAVVLYAYESLPYEEIAQVLGTSVSSVKSLIFRGRTTLREKLAHFTGY
ncbi:RNA polymerase sigma-70 factor (ECF subfamily) [Haloferula luteola]|uniref:RNA polymerase sigma factor n=1 Tax=Haloferula luteola TaxID=595692 RepID=A0A840VKB3_9BACT|nr:sigma-70 family RNA polymerase sigma factor [Haloferula luteola]MBB5353111.1 RNA polymerase sigma-70 factor (ECF subfamily) [Haloferula luteola]